MGARNREKSVQIPEKLFSMIGFYFLENRREPELETEIIKGLQDKLDRQAAREIFSKYQNEKLSPKEREAARIEYLKSQGISTDFIWPENYQP